MKPKPTMTPEQIAEWEKKAQEGRLWEYAGTRGEKARAIVEAALQRWPDKIIPYGGRSELAREFVCRTGTVFNLLSLEGFQSASRVADHGTVNRYQHYGCRCDECKKANAARQAEWRRKRKAR